MQRHTERQERLFQELSRSEEPLTGSDLAQRCGVTRQVVVHDIALLRASGIAILSTPRGYCLQRERPGHRSVLSVNHPPEMTEIELNTLVDFGITVVDVVVDHPVYGELRGLLHLSSRRDVALFMAQIGRHEAPLLSSLSGGQHLHSVEAPNQARLSEAIAALRERGIEVFD